MLVLVFCKYPFPAMFSNIDLDLGETPIKRGHFDIAQRCCDLLQDEYMSAVFLELRHIILIKNEKFIAHFRNDLKNFDGSYEYYKDRK